MYQIEPGKSVNINFADHKKWFCSKVSNGVAILFPDGTERAYVYAVPVDKVEFGTYEDDVGEYVEFYCSVGDCRKVTYLD